MKKLLIGLVILLGVAGCHEVVMSARYSALLDQRAAIARQYSKFADANQLTAEASKQALRLNADAWQQFQFARDGKDANGVKR